MVGVADCVIYLTFIALKCGTHHDIVEPEVKTIQMVGYASPKARLCKGIFQLPADDVVGVGDRRIVEVAHRYHMRMLALCDGLCHALCLRSTLGRILS